MGNDLGRVLKIKDNNSYTFATDIKLGDNSKSTKEGYRDYFNVVIGRIGSQTYLGSEIKGLGLKDNERVEIHRLQEDVFHPDTLNSAVGKPLTDGHPIVDVTVDNFKELSKGFMMGIPIRVADDMVTTVRITDKDIIRLIDDNKKRELSLGYDTVIVFDEARNILKQTQILINHLALVEHGRAGNAKILDERTIKESDDSMNKENITINIVLSDEIQKKLEKEKEIELMNKEEMLKIFGTMSDEDLKSVGLSKIVDKDKETNVDDEEKKKAKDKKAKDEENDAEKEKRDKREKEQLKEQEEKEKEDRKKIGDEITKQVQSVFANIQLQSNLQDQKIEDSLKGFDGEEVNDHLQKVFDQFRPEAINEKVYQTRDQEIMYVNNLKEQNSKKYFNQGGRK